MDVNRDHPISETGIWGFFIRKGSLLFIIQSGMRSTQEN